MDYLEVVILRLVVYTRVYNFRVAIVSFLCNHWKDPLVPSVGRWHFGILESKGAEPLKGQRPQPWAKAQSSQDTVA